MTVGEGKAIGTGYTRNDVSNNIADGNVINAADLDGEFDAIEAAFNASTGHTHDGTSAEGAPIVVIGPAQEWIVDGTSLRPKLDNTYDIGTNAAEVRNLWVDGTANIDSLVADTADINGGTVDGAVIGGSVPAAITGTTITATTGFVGPLTGTVTGNAATASLAAQATALATNRTFSITGDVTASAVNFNGTGNVVLNATIDPDLAAIGALSWANNEAPIFHTGAWQKYTVSGYSRSLLTATDAAGARTTLGATATGSSLFTAADQPAGRTALGLGTMATQAATSVNIDGGAIDGTTIGSSSPNSGVFTNLRVTSTDFPALDFRATGAEDSFEITRLVRGTSNFAVTVQDSSGTFVQTAYNVQLGTSGAVTHAFRVAATDRLTVDVLGAQVNGTFSSNIITAPFIAVDNNGTFLVGTNSGIVSQGNNVSFIGEAARRFSNIFLVNAPNVSSDARLKENIADLTEAERRAAAKIKTRTFTMKDGGQKKVGYIAQEIIEAMDSEGLCAFEYGLVSDGETYGVDYDAVNAFRLG